MKKQILINLFGSAGKRTVEISTRGGFLTRHIKAPRETVPSISALVKPKPEQTPETTAQKTEQAPPTLLEVLHWMEASEDFTGWLIIDEILFVASAKFNMKYNHDALLDALRHLYKEGLLGYKRNRFNQHCFCLIEKAVETSDLKALLAEVDAIMGEGGN